LDGSAKYHCETVIGVPTLNRQRYARERPIA
jgi:hypothetical protein